MRIKIFLLALLSCAVCAFAPAPPNQAGSQQGSLLQRNTELSAVAKRKKPRPAQPAIAFQPVFRGGPADPSIGPDGRPYRVPEYLRNQCYIDDGYGRFSACNNRN